MIRKVLGKGQGRFPEGRNVGGCKLSFEIETKGHGQAEVDYQLSSNTALKVGSEAWTLAESEAAEMPGLGRMHKQETALPAGRFSLEDGQ